MPWHSTALQARFEQLTAALHAGASASPTALDGVSRPARLALRAFNAFAHGIQSAATSEPHEHAVPAASPHASAPSLPPSVVLPREIERLACSASGLARALARTQAAKGRAVDGIALAHHVRALSIEMNHPLDPITIATTLRRVLAGTSQWEASGATGRSTITTTTIATTSTLATLFTHIALVLALAQHPVP